MKLDPIDIIAHTSTGAKLGWGLAAVSLVVAAASPYFTIAALKQHEKVVILDPGTSLIYSPVLEFKSATELHAQSARWAIAALLLRNPAGADDPELLNRLYVDPARLKAKQLLDNTANDFCSKQLHQKFSLAKLKILNTPPVAGRETITVWADGQLIKTGLDKGVPFTETAKFSGKWVFARNPDVSRNNLFPMCVFDFDIHETPDKSSQ